MKMKKYKLFYVLFVASIANFFLTINVTNANAINQSSLTKSRNLSDSNSSKTKTNFPSEESDLKKSNGDKFNRISSNLPNIKQPNIYNHHQKSHLSKFSHNDEKKDLKNVFNMKLPTKEKRIKREEKDCKKIYYPVYYIKNINCKEDMDPNAGSHSFYPQNPSNEYPFHLFNKPGNIPYDFSDYDNDDDCYEVNNNNCLDVHNPTFLSSISESEEDVLEEDNVQDEQGFSSKKKVQTSDEAFKYESKESIGKALEVSSNVSHQSSSSERKEIHSFKELSVRKQNILQETIIKVLNHYDSTLKSNYGITNLKDIFAVSEVEKMITNSTRSLLLSKSEEFSRIEITDEIIKSCLADVINNNALGTEIGTPETADKPLNKSTLIPIAEVNFKIGQWVQNIGKSDSGTKQENEVKSNTFNIETQINPSVQYQEPGNGMSLTVNSGSRPVKTKFSIEIENPKVLSSESDVIEKLPIKYYDSTNKLLDYRKNHHHSEANQQNMNYNSNQAKGLEEQSFHNHRQYFSGIDRASENQLSRNRVNYNNDNTLGLRHNQNVGGNSQITGSLQNKNSPADQNFFLSSERNIKEQNQFSEASRNKLNSKSENTFHSASNGNFNGNSQIDSSSKHEKNVGNDRSLNTLRNRESSENTQIRGSTRNKKHVDPDVNFDDTSEGNIYKNARIFGLLRNNQNSYTTDSYPTTSQNNENSQLHGSSESNYNSKMNDNSFTSSNLNISENSKFLGSPSRTVNIVNDELLWKTGIQKNDKIGSYEVNNDHNIHEFHTEYGNNITTMKNDVNSSKVLNYTKLSKTPEGEKHWKSNNFNYRRGLNFLGRLIPQNKENSEFIYEGNFLRLPLKLRKLNDGSFLVILLNKIRNCSSRNNRSSNNLSRNQPGINKRDIEGKIIKKDDSFAFNPKNQEINIMTSSNKSKEEDFITNFKKPEELTKDKKDEREQYKQYLETLLDVNNIPTEDRPIVITDAMQKIPNNQMSNSDINNKYKSEKDGLKNNLVLEETKSKPNKKNVKVKKSEENSRCSVSAGVDILKVILNWVKDIILTSLKKK